MPTSEFNPPPSPAADPADAPLFVLQIMRENNSGAKLAFESFVAASISHYLGMVGSDFSDHDVIRAIDSFRRRSPSLFYTAPDEGVAGLPVANSPRRRKRRRRR